MKNLNKIKSEIIHTNPRFEVIKDTYKTDNGKTYPYYSFNEGNGFIVVLGINDDMIMMVKQFRIPIKQISYEFVGGYIEDGEVPEEAAKREFLEETGYICDEVKKIGVIKAGVNKANAVGHVFIASGFTESEKNLDEFEEVIGLESSWVPLDKISYAIKSGYMVDTTTLAAWTLYREM